MKKEVREKLNSIIELKKKQIKIIEKGYIKPQKDNISLIKQCLKGEISIERVIKHSEAVNKHLGELIKRK